MSRLVKVVLFIMGLIALFYLIMTLTEKQRFLSHLRSNTPNPYKECVVAYVDTHWDRVHQEYWQRVNDNSERMPRGRTDIVKSMINAYVPLCDGD
ncbi:MAG: hypothetical protein Q3971_00315 [Moraxella sp.]|nr:hypothetical protein [Moraxella sp.]